MHLSPGTRIGPYELRDPLGSGGMGVVYRARDAKLNRDVAIKILPDVFALDPARLARFTREAQTLASLNHPNIAHVYGIEDSPSAGSGPVVHALVMELVDGQDLSSVIARGPMPLDEALTAARQIAEALEAAHERGIVHRDLKPGNIRVTNDGTVKVLDFGLAKAVDPTSSSGPALEQSPTFTSPALTTGLGVVLGTAAYMAPEQARGKAVDRRADIWAFGVVLYEMLAGRRLFEGAEVSDVLASVLRQDVDWSALPASTPPRLRRLIERCLDRDPRQRLRDIGEARVEIGRIERGEGEAASLPGVATPRSWADRRMAIVGAAAVAAGALLALVGSRLVTRPAPAESIALDVAPPVGYALDVGSALSPDGTQLALTVVDRRGTSHLAIRRLSTGETRIVPDSDEAEAPFWSPDGASVAFFVPDRLRTHDIATSRSRVICDVRGARRAGSWNTRGVILFSSEAGVPVMKVSADGGAPVPLERALGFRPFFLPDQRHFLLGRQPTTGPPSAVGIAVVDSESGEVIQLRPDGAEPKYSAGSLLFVLRGQLMAQPFDAAALRLSGVAAPIAEIGRHSGSTGANFTVAGSTIAFAQPSQAMRALTWFTRAGVPTPIGEAADWRNPALSPDDSLVALQRHDPVEDQYDIWLLDTTRGTGRMFVSGRPEPVSLPFWAPDGLVVRFGRRGTGLMEKPVDAPSERKVPGDQGDQAVGGGRMLASGMTPDGAVIGFTLNAGNRDILYFTPSGERKYFATSPANETQPATSPDGRWIAYVSDGEGYDVARSILVDAFPGGGHRVKVSGELPGVQPRWRRDGRELFYLGVDGRLVALAVETSAAGIRFGLPQPLFQTSLAPEAGLGTRASYDGSRDGSRFLVSEPQEDRRLGARQAGPAIRVLLNWPSALGAKPAGAP